MYKDENLFMIHVFGVDLEYLTLYYSLIIICPFIITLQYIPTYHTVMLSGPPATALT